MKPEDKPNFASEEETIPYLEKVRKNYRKRHLLFSLLAGLVILLGILLIVFAPLISDGRFFVLFLLLGLLVILFGPVPFLLRAQAQKIKYRTQVYTTLLLFDTLHTYDKFAFIYDMNQIHISNKLKLKEKYKVTEEAVTKCKGSLHKTGFISFDYVLDKHKEEGKYIAFHTPYFVSSPVLIRAKNQQDWFSYDDKMKVKVIGGNEEFDSLYDVYGEEEDGCYYLLTPKLVKEILSLCEKIHAGLTILYQDNYCIVYLTYGKKPYQVRFNHPFDSSDLEEIKESYHLIADVYQSLIMGE